MSQPTSRRSRTKPADPYPIDLTQPLWTIGQVSEYLHIPVSTLHKWRQRNYGPRAHRLGGALRYIPGDVVRFAEWETPGETS